MYTLISIFYISLLGMAGLIFLKRREVRTGRLGIVSRMSSGTDHLFQALFVAGRRGLSYFNRRTFIAIAHWTAFHVLLNIRKVYVGVKARFLANPHGKRLIDAVRGRGEIRNHGASFYLRRISADQKK